MVYMNVDTEIFYTTSGILSNFSAPDIQSLSKPASLGCRVRETTGVPQFVQVTSRKTICTDVTDIYTAVT
jgi:hypothetical protein